jgi:phage terminase large subunit-like protein
VTAIMPDESDLGVLAEFGRRLKEAPADPRSEWRRTARPEQLLPDGDYRVFLLTGGRGSGKSRAGSQGLAEIILSDPEPGGQFGICAPTYRDAWTVDVEGESGILRALGTTPGEVKHGTSRLVEYAHRSYGEIGLRNGHIIYVDSADDGALRIQGKNLRAIWADELGLWSKWQVAWDESIRYAVRKGASKIIATGTPKVSRPARALIRRLLRGEEPGVIVRRLRTIDNAANLSDAFIASVVGSASGTRLERQELEGELLDDVDNALWTRTLLESIQVPAVGAEDGIPYLHGAVIGVDPSDGSEDSDEQAYTIAGKGQPGDPHLYVVESFGAQLAPAAFARKVILKAVEWNARIVVERNHGGAWLTATFHQVLKELDAAGRLPEGRKPRVETIWASQAKRTRAEPVSALYERGIVRHAGGPFVELEDQQCSFTGTAGERSPDRLDSCVFALHPFLNASFGPPGSPGVRKWAGAAELEVMGQSPEAAMRKRRQVPGAPGGRQEAPEDAPWSLDGFSAQDDREGLEGGQRGNVRSWR